MTYRPCPPPLRILIVLEIQFRELILGRNERGGAEAAPVVAWRDGGFGRYIADAPAHHGGDETDQTVEYFPCFSGADTCFSHVP
jgi:hypothetical protein